LPSIASILPPLPRLKIVDVGAMWTGEGADRYANLMRTLPCDVVGFEPVAAECQRLIAMGRPQHRYFPYFIGDGSTRMFHECRAPFTSSLLEPDLAMARNFEHLAEVMQVVRTHQVQTTRLDDVPGTADVDLLKVDVQGGEMMVFEGAPQRLTSALVVDVEVEFIPFYKNQPLFGEIDFFLRGRGFMLHRLLPYNLTLKPAVAKGEAEATSQQTAWADAVYVRNAPGFGMLEPVALLKLAAILHENYRSYDLAARVLGAYDRMMPTDLQSRYARLVSTPASAGRAI
jgi:FkbM family methyltransferase